MTNIPEAIAYYNGLVEAHESRISEIFSEFSRACEASKLTFGGRSMYNFLRPNFISLDQYRSIRYVCRVLRNAVTKFKDAALADPRMMEQAGIIAKEKELVGIDPGYDRLSVTARWDSFIDGDSLKFVELNAECPAGIAYSDVAAGVYDTLPFVKQFKKKYSVQKFRIRGTLLDELLATYRKYRGHKRNKKPAIAIVDWKEVPTFTEFQLFEEFFRSKGFTCVIADPRDLTYENGRLRSGNTEIDLVYKRILTNDCVEKPAETRALVEAYRNHDVCMINSFRAKIVHKKSIFAVLTHEKNRHLFSKEELGIISKHIPWTRMIRNEHTGFRGRDIDLVAHITKDKNEFVIKPNDEYGGKGVYLGKETGQEQWDNVIREALTGEPYVVQEIVKIPRVGFPVVTAGRLQFVDMVVDLDPYVFGPKVEGLLTRLSASSLANVTAGGGTTPTFVISKKSGNPYQKPAVCKDEKKGEDSKKQEIEKEEKIMKDEEAFTIGIEEEFQIVDPETRELRSHVSGQMIEEGKLILSEQIKMEMHQSVVEVGTNICKTVHDAREEVVKLRKTISQLAQKRGLRIVAASTHPISDWKTQEISDHQRYREIVENMQDLARANLIFGLHIHIGMPDNETCIAIMNQIRYFLPHILALSTSSPFWIGRNTGLSSFRTRVFQRFPRTDLPPIFDSWSTFADYVNLLVETKCIDTGKKIWWDARPHPNFGTLEIRICDLPTRVDETIAIAALVQALMYTLFKLYKKNMAWRLYSNALISENKWRASRYGLNGKLIDFGKKQEVHIKELIYELIQFVDESVEELGSRSAINYIYKILDEGTSADRQVKVFKESGNNLQAVVDHLINDTLFGIT